MDGSCVSIEEGHNSYRGSQAKIGVRGDKGDSTRVDLTKRAGYV